MTFGVSIESFRNGSNSSFHVFTKLLSEINEKGNLLSFVVLKVNFILNSKF